MGKEALRTAVKVDLKKDAWTCDYLHVRCDIGYELLNQFMLTVVEPMASGQ